MRYDTRVRIVDVFEHPVTGATINLIGVSAYVRDVQLGWVNVQPACWPDGQVIDVPSECVVREPLGMRAAA
jgi:hypothetical protein